VRQWRLRGYRLQQRLGSPGRTRTLWPWKDRAAWTPLRKPLGRSTLALVCSTAYPSGAWHCLGPFEHDCRFRSVSASAHGREPAERRLDHIVRSHGWQRLLCHVRRGTEATFRCGMGLRCHQGLGTRAACWSWSLPEGADSHRNTLSGPVTGSVASRSSDLAGHHLALPRHAALRFTRLG
jgi:hypothetical protein